MLFAFGHEQETSGVFEHVLAILLLSSTAWGLICMGFLLSRDHAAVLLAFGNEQGTADVIEHVLAILSMTFFSVLGFVCFLSSCVFTENIPRCLT